MGIAKFYSIRGEFEGNVAVVSGTQGGDVWYSFLLKLQKVLGSTPGQAASKSTDCGNLLRLMQRQLMSQSLSGAKPSEYTGEEMS